MAKDFDSDTGGAAPTDDSGWNTGRPILIFNCQGVFKGRVMSARTFMKDTGQGQLAFEVLPISVVSLTGGELPEELNPEDLSAVGTQRFGQYVDTRDNRQIDRVRKLCASLGSSSAKVPVERVGIWASEINDSKPEVYFQTTQPKAREGYPNVDEDGQPIYTISRISAAPIAG